VDPGSNNFHQTLVQGLVLCQGYLISRIPPSRTSATSTTRVTGRAPANWNGIPRSSDDAVYVGSADRQMEALERRNAQEREQRARGSVNAVSFVCALDLRADGAESCSL